MALASCVEARSVVELSLSPLYHYQFSSLSKSIKALARDEAARLRLSEHLVALFLRYASLEGPLLLQTDATSLCKPNSPTLPERTYVLKVGAAIGTNKPISAGYEISAINLSLGRWSLPLSMGRVTIDQTAADCAQAQLSDLLPLLGEGLRVNTLDSSYGKAAYLAPTYAHENLVNVVRLRQGIKLWLQASDPGPGGGTAKIYGERYYLLQESRYHSYTHNRTKVRCQSYQRALGERSADSYASLSLTTARGRPLIVHLWRYNDLLMRTKRGHNMKHKPFDVVIAVTCDAQTGVAIYATPLYLAIAGQRKSEIATESAFQFYHRRYDIEPFFRFAKQRLMFERYQSPLRDHLENWLLVVQIASWLLFTARDEVHFRPRKWERVTRQRSTPGSITQTYRSAQGLFLTFDPGLFKPPKAKKGKGRPKGMRFEPRKRYRVRCKQTPGARTMRRYLRKAAAKK